MTFNLSKLFGIVSLLLLFLWHTSPVMAQSSLLINGKVADKKGEPIIGATIKISGTSTATITDLNGDFAIKCTPQSVLNISYIGYQSQTVKLNGKSQLSIELLEDEKTLNEVVVVGYGVQRKSDLTGSVSSVKVKDAVKVMPVANVTDALQGRLAGVSIVSSSGAPNAGSTIRVRGVNSFSADTGPLVVIDGFIGGDLSSLNPSDILSVEVLKDASATAVYGSRGANGVILVSTRKPEKGKTKVDYAFYANIKTPYKLPDMLMPYQFADLANQYAKSIDKTANPFYTEEQMTAFRNGTAGYDYLDHIFNKGAFQQVHELSVSGGSDATNFLFSGSYNNNEGIVRSSKSERVNYRLKVDTDIFKWAKLGLNIWGDYAKSQGPRFSQYRGVLIESLVFPNTIMPRNENGKYNNQNLLGPQYNPMGHVEQVNSDGYAYNSFLQAYLDINIMKGLTFRMLQGFTFGNTLSAATNGPDSYAASSLVNGITDASATNTSRNNWTNTNILSYIKEFNQNHRVNATLVFEQQQYNAFYVRGTGRGLVSDEVGHNNVNLAKRVEAESNKATTTMLSGLARINYALLNSYIFTASYRKDGSSRLAHENAWDGFASAAFAWDVKNDTFLQNTKIFSAFDQLKFRLGYGETGNQAVAPYSAFSEYKVARDANQNMILSFERVGNPNLRWERTNQTNIGLDMGFFNNRLTFNVDYYHKLSKNVLLEVDIPQYSGFSKGLRNVANVLNQGVEVTIGGDPFVGKNFSWNTNFTFSNNKTSIEKLADGVKYITLGTMYEQKFYRYILGQKVGTLYGYTYDGVWTTDEINKGLAPAKTEAGAYKYINRDDNPNITDADCSVIGNGQPKFNWGWTNSLNYKNFDFGFFVIGYHGFDIYNYTAQARMGLSPNPKLLDRWQAGTNENASIAGFIKTPDLKPQTSQFVENGSFIKVKSITLGYSLPSVLLNKIHLSKCRVYASVQNPFLITKYSGIDPEVALKDPLMPGIDYGYYPNGRNFLVGLNVAF